MAQKAGYFKLPNGETRYSDGQGGVFHDHTGPWLTQIGNLFGNPGFGRTTEQHTIGADGSIGGRVRGVPGQLPSNYKREELKARGDVPGQLPADYKATEAATFAAANDGGGGNEEPAPAEPRRAAPPASGRDTAPPRPGADSGAKGTQTSPSSRMDVLYTRINSPQGDGGFGIPFNFKGNAPTIPGNSNQQQTNTQYSTQDEAFAVAYHRGEVTPYLKGYTGDMNDRSAQMAFARNHGYTGAMTGFGVEGSNPQAGNSPVPDEAESQTEVSMPGAISKAHDEFSQFVKQDEEAQSELSTKEDRPSRRPRGARAAEIWERQQGSAPKPAESTATGRPRSNRSFLDYDGPGGSLMALRALEASQGTMKQNGVTYGRDSTGKWVQLTDEAAGALKNDRSSVATVDFVDANRYKPVSKETAEQDTPETPSIATPTPASKGKTTRPTPPPAPETPLESSIDTQDIPDPVKDPQVFLSERLNKALSKVKPYGE